MFFFLITMGSEDKKIFPRLDCSVIFIFLENGNSLFTYFIFYILIAFKLLFILVIILLGLFLYVTYLVTLQNIQQL